MSYLKPEGRDFTNEEFSEIMKRSSKLVLRGYFTGINFIRSQDSLPGASLIAHFLHNNPKHVESITACLETDFMVIPRETYYRFKKQYFAKPSFEEEYRGATFYDAAFCPLTLKEAKCKNEDCVVLNKEIDLLIPLFRPDILRPTIDKIIIADRAGPDHWEDPVLIIRTDSPVKNLEGFVQKSFVSIGKNREEFYVVLYDTKKADALCRYLDKLCAKTRIGTLKRSDAVFTTSQVNDEFARYLADIEAQLEEIEPFA